MSDFTKEEEQAMVEEIREKFPDCPWPEVSVERLQIAGMHDMGAIPGKAANVIWTVDDNGNEIPNVVGIRSDEYKFIRYEVLVKKFEEIIDQYDQFGKPKFTFFFPKDGARFICQVDFPEVRKTLKDRAGKGDIAPQCGFKSSLDMGWEYSVYIGAIRLVCTNGMVAFHLESQMRKKHRMTLDVNKLNEYVIPTLNKFDDQMRVWDAWSQTEFTTIQTEKLIEELPFGSRHQEEILALPEASTGETLEQWMRNGKVNAMDMYNVYTQFLSHNIESEMVRVEKGRRVAQVFHNHKRYTG